jgi:hypothetical protein
MVAPMTATRALVPEDRFRARPSTFVFRAAAAHVRSAASPRGAPLSVEGAARQLFGRDDVTELVLKAATAPATTTTTGWAAELAAEAVYDLVATTTSLSAAADIIGRGLRADLTGIARLRVPGRVLNAAQAGTWIDETAPVPVRAMSFSNAATLEPRKLMVITTYTREMAESSNIEAITKQTVSEASGLALDAALLSTAPDDGVHPGGILPATPLTPTTGGGPNAMTGDLAKLFAALAANGAGKNAVIVAAVPQSVTLKLTVGPKFDVPILASSVLAAGTVVGVDTASFVSGYGSTPEFSTSTATVLHEEDTNPANIGSAGTPPIVAAPSRSLFQTDAIALRMLLRASWAMRAAGHVQYITGATW